MCRPQGEKFPSERLGGGAALTPLRRARASVFTVRGGGDFWSKCTLFRPLVLGVYIEIFERKKIRQSTAHVEISPLHHFFWSGKKW